MKKITALLCFIMLAHPAMAQTRMRDFSAPISESLKRQDTPSSPTGFYNNTGGNSRYQGLGGSNAGSGYEAPQEQADHYLDGYCDPNFVPIASRNRNVANCLKQQKETACSQFSRMPKDVKKTLYLATDCAYEASENGATQDDEDYSTSSARGCSSADTRRLQLAKKYWDKEEVVEALVFLPDAVLSDASSCIDGRE